MATTDFMNDAQTIIDAVNQAFQNANISHSVFMAANGVNEAAMQFAKASVLFRPKLSMDGNKWCALYGDDLATGCAGFGDSPAEAMGNFDAAWYKSLNPPTR